MAYSAISNSEIDTDSALTTTLMQKYRDNLLAVAAGLSGAPRVNSNGMRFRRSIVRDQVKTASGQSLGAIDIGESRQQVVNVSCFWGRYVLYVGLPEPAVPPSEEDGDSFVYLQGSNDSSSWANLVTIASYDNTGTEPELIVRDNVMWDGVAESAAYRYYRIYAEGDPDHIIEGDFYIHAMGD